MLAVLVAGFKGPEIDLINGLYQREGEFNGRPLYRKDIKPERWLLFASDGKWMIVDERTKRDNGAFGFGVSAEAGLAHPSMVKTWRKYGYEAQPHAVVTTIATPLPIVRTKIIQT